MKAGVGGDGLELIRHRRGAANGEACDWAREWLGLEAARPAYKAKSGAEKVAEIVARSEGIAGTRVEVYLRRRCITASPPDCIGFRRFAAGQHGALVALATDADGAVLAVQNLPHRGWAQGPRRCRQAHEQGGGRLVRARLNALVRCARSPSEPARRRCRAADPAATGARRGEALGARWDQFDLEAAVWIKPAATTKQRRLHRAPQSALQPPRCCERSGCVCPKVASGCFRVRPKASRFRTSSGSGKMSGRKPNCPASASTIFATPLRRFSFRAA